MLKIKGQIKLKSLKGITLAPNILYDRIGVYYRVMNLQISAEDFLHLLNCPPEINLWEGEKFHLTVNNDTNNQYLKMELINQMLNLLLLLEQRGLSYQDSIFVTSMLKKTGIKQTGELLRDIRRSLKEAGTIKKLTDMYRCNGSLIRELARGKEKKSAVRYALSSVVYQRLQTEKIYHEVYEKNRQYDSAMQTVNHQELIMAEQIRAARSLFLFRLQKECTFRESGGIELYINPYEAGAGKETTVTRETVLSEILSAAVLGLVNNIWQIRREQMEQRIYPQFWIVQSLYHSMKNVFDRYEIFHTGKMWRTAELYPFMEDNSRLWDSEINLLEELAGNETVMRISDKTVHSALWQQALIYRLSQNEDYNLSEAVRNVFMEYSQQVQDINKKTKRVNGNQIKQIMNGIKNRIKNEKNNLVEQTESHFFETDQNMLQNKQEVHYSEQITHGLLERIRHDLSLSRKIQLIRQAVQEYPGFFVKKSEYRKIIENIRDKRDEYFSEEKQKSVNETISKMVCELINSTIKDITEQASDNQSKLVKELLKVRETSEIIKEIGNTGCAYSQTVFRRNRNIHIKEKVFRELQQITEKDERYMEIYNGFAENSDTVLRETAEIQKESQNREMLRQLQEINQKNIEKNRKYRQEMQQRNIPVSRLHPDGKKTIREGLKVIHASQNESAEIIESIQNNPSPVIDETVRKLASGKTVEILEKIIEKESGNAGKAEAALQSEIREIERQVELQTKQQESFMSQSLTREKFRAAGESPVPVQNPLKGITFIHKEQNDLTEETFLPYLQQYGLAESGRKNSRKETVVNHRTETKEISRKIDPAVPQSKEEVEELVRRNLQRQMETITDRVVDRIEKKLQMERRRRGY